jgi:argininosuccinate synthase
LNVIGGEHGVGRGIHVGDTILGIKGRVGFEAPAALTLISAHRELEKVVLTKWQQQLKKQASEMYGMLLHEGQYFDPVMRDIESMLDSSQEAVTGSVQVRFLKGTLQVMGCNSEYSMFNQSVATYGEENVMWTADDARGFAKIAKTQAALARKALPHSVAH